MKFTTLSLLLLTMFGSSIQGMEKPSQSWKEWLFSRWLPISVPEKYSIHLMWINKDANQNKQYIYPSDKEFTALKEWSFNNPEAQVCLWYDSAMINPSQKEVDNTQEIIKWDGKTSKKYRSHCIKRYP